MTVMARSSHHADPRPLLYGTGWHVAPASRYFGHGSILLLQEPFALAADFYTTLSIIDMLRLVAKVGWTRPVRIVKALSKL